MSANNDKKKKTGKSTDKAAKTPGIAPTLVFAVLTAVVMHIFVWSVFVVLYTFTGHTKSCEALHITVCLLAVLVYFIIRSNLIYLGKVRTAGFFFGFHVEEIPPSRGFAPFLGMTARGAILNSVIADAVDGQS